MSKAAEFDKEILAMIKADEVRAAFVPGARKNFYLIEEPWSMVENPWRIQWFSPVTKSWCMINPVLEPQGGEKYVMFQMYEEDTERVCIYVFLNDQYHYLEDDQ